MAKRYTVTCKDCGNVQSEWDFNADIAECDNCRSKNLEWKLKKYN